MHYCVIDLVDADITIVPITWMMAALLLCVLFPLLNFINWKYWYCLPNANTDKCDTSSL